MHDDTATLAAVATAPGRGGVGCVRISGPRAFEIAGRMFAGVAPLELPGDGRPRFGKLLDVEGSPIDHGYAVAFAPTRAYTAEPTVELWSHGSPPVLEALVRSAIANGAVPAGAGEFTYRALRHGRLGLAEAEAVRDLIAATTLLQARVAFRQVDGSLARRLAPLREEIMDLIARGEAAIEFSDEAETHLEAGGLERRIASARRTASELAADARRGRVVRQGARLALLGSTSVGKSSIFNRLLGNDRAIVSPVPGTTRDTLEEGLDVMGIPVTLIDTAGVRAPGDAVEAEGVRRARAASGEADLVLLVLDASRPVSEDERRMLSMREAREHPPAIVVANKIDLRRERRVDSLPQDALPVSALTGEGFERLRDAIAGRLRGAGALEDPTITNERHASAIERCADALDRASEAAAWGDDIVLEEARAALSALGEITGETASDELYDRIFTTFCIGK
jgi:tRNA modification GTPase